MGFIGRNGAGKTTTIKSILNLVHADAGTVTVLGMDFAREEFACKQKIGLVLGGINYYPQKKLKVNADVTRKFYPEWDEAAFNGYLKRFDLDAEKTIKELSDGMRVKFALALALSHNAQLLILDEPTSGLDPVSRDDLLELFQELIENSERSILFSTQITSDLEKCADFITYIKKGEIIASTDKDTFLSTYKIVKGTRRTTDRFPGIKTDRLQEERLRFYCPHENRRCPCHRRPGSFPLRPRIHHDPYRKGVSHDERTTL